MDDSKTRRQQRGIQGVNTRVQLMSQCDGPAGVGKPVSGRRLLAKSKQWQLNGGSQPQRGNHHHHLAARSGRPMSKKHGRCTRAWQC